jgi:hypothetical protein
MKLKSIPADPDTPVVSMEVDGIKIKIAELEKYLGSRFVDIYDGGIMNISTRIMIAKSKLKKMEKIFYNEEIDYDVKLDMYMVDIRPVLLHGAEFWSLREKNIDKLESFQRATLLQIVGRNDRDRIRSNDMYNWIQWRGFEIYPIRYELADRKLRYFAMIERGDPKDLARKIFWSDFKAAVKDKDFEYEHIKDIKTSLRTLKMVAGDMNEGFSKKKKWKKAVQGSKGLAYEIDRKLEDKKYFEDVDRKIASGEYAKEVEEEKNKNGGWVYRRREMPGSMWKK